MASRLGKCFPPWTVTHAAWTTALGPKVFGMATDMMIFRQHGPGLFTDTLCTLIISLTSHYMNPSWRSSLVLPAGPLKKPAQRLNVDTSPMPLGPVPPAQKSAHATATVTSAAGASSDAPTLTQDPLLLQIPDSRVLLAHLSCCQVASCRV